jgi:hypothetical protein
MSTPDISFFVFYKGVLMARKRLDFAAVKCVDTGHHWDEVYFGRADRGFLKGMPVRINVCATCHSQRLDHLTWDGDVTSRQYAWDESYLLNARMLGDHPERRKKLRKAKAQRMKREGEWHTPSLRVVSQDKHAL